MHRLVVQCACFVVMAPLAAQAPGPGLSWQGTAGGSVSSWFPTCTSLAVGAVRGDPVTLRIWGDLGSLYVLAVASTATSCVPLPGLGNGLVLDLPAFPIVGGVLTQPTPCLACPPAFEPLSLVVPATLPVGATLALQAAGFGAGQFALTTAITASIQ